MGVVAVLRSLKLVWKNVWRHFESGGGGQRPAPDLNLEIGRF